MKQYAKFKAPYSKGFFYDTSNTCLNKQGNL